MNTITSQKAIDLINNEITCIKSTQCKREECNTCHCSDESGNYVFSSTDPEFTRIEIEKENDDRPRTNADYLRSLSDDKLADWLCHQFWDDYDEDDVINIVRYNQVRNFLKMEHK